MSPTQSTYLYTGEGTPDTTGWPVSGFGTVPTQTGEAPKPLYYSALDTPNADPFTTAGAGAPGWELYTGPAQPIAGSPVQSGASTEQTTTSPSSAISHANGPTPSNESATAPSVTDAASTSASEGGPTATTPAPPVSAPVAPEQPPAPSQPATLEESPVEPETTSPVPPAVIEGIVYRGRTDDDVLTGTFCRVIAGEHQGRYGVFTNTATITLDGWPATVTVRTRDDRDENITVNYADIRPAQAGGR
jgi:hypothetical protein